MLIFDQLKRSDHRLRLLALGVLAGMGVLLAGLWWVQIVRSRHYVENLRNQSFRTVRLPAIRGKIFDRHGNPLVENRPTYNINLYLDELRPLFQQEYKAVRGTRKLTRDEIAMLGRETRYRVVNNAVQNLSATLREPIHMDARAFHQHYEQRLALPLAVLADLNMEQIAAFQERYARAPGLDLEVLPIRVYPKGATAAHVLGFLKRDDTSMEGEDASFNYRLPDYKGVVGVEATFDSQLRGRAGVKSVLVNNLGYRQSENLWDPAEPGKNLVLTIDLPIQEAAEAALKRSAVNPRGAVVVMDGNSGDLLALVSSPSFDPNHFLPRITQAEWDRLNDEKLRPMRNRATQEIYAPGSIFKIVVGLAALEAGLDPEAKYTVEPDPQRPGRGCIFIGRRKIEDTAEAGDYNFRRAFIRSSNAYFIHHGLLAGFDNLLKISQRLHLGERAEVPTYQESAGILPTRDWIKRHRGGWSDGDTANICIGQGDIAVTPLQMAVMTAAIANGGKVLWPRLVDRIEPQDRLSNEPVKVFPAARVRDELGVSARTLELTQEAMFADVTEEGTGKAAAVPGMKIGGKTGTAQVMQGRKVVDHTTWFTSFCEHNGRLYVVLVMVESGSSGGGTCAPVAQQIYRVIQKRAEEPAKPPGTLAATPR
jgi:penicillin-binding protein 2